MKPKLEFIEQTPLKLVDSEKAKTKLPKGPKGSLWVYVDATHSGYINRNFTLYEVDGMRKSAPSWTKPYKKPVLVHHDDYSDPIGRVYRAVFIEDAKKKRGKIRLLINITEQTAIDKIMDGRYSTVSIGGRPVNKITCSICEKNLLKTGFCGHWRGDTYKVEVDKDKTEERKCYYTLDRVDYTEVSFVNKPADQSRSHVAQVIGWELADKDHDPAPANKDDSTEAEVNVAGNSEDLWYPEDPDLENLEVTDEDVADLSLWKSCGEDILEYLDSGGLLTRNEASTPTPTGAFIEEHITKDREWTIKTLVDVYNAACQEEDVNTNDVVARCAEHLEMSPEDAQGILEFITYVKDIASGGIYPPKED